MKYISSPLLLTKPIPGEELFLYLLVAPTVISTALVCEEDRIQHPIYYISHILCDTEIHNNKIENLLLAHVIAAQRLRPYFHAHHVSTNYSINYPPQTSLAAPHIYDRMAKCHFVGRIQSEVQISNGYERPDTARLLQRLPFKPY